MRALILLASLALLPLSGCDSGGGGTDDDDDGGGNGVCATFGFRSGGIFTADVGGEALRLDCYNAFSESGLTYLTGYQVGASATQIRSQLTLVIGGASAGSYVIGGSDPSDVSTAQYAFLTASGNEDLRAETGQIQVTTYSETRLSGTFSFVTDSGVSISDGVFDVNISDLL